MIVVDIDGGLVDQERHPVVRDETVVLEDKGERLEIDLHDRHRVSPARHYARSLMPDSTDGGSSRSLGEFKNETAHRRSRIPARPTQPFADESERRT